MTECFFDCSSPWTYLGFHGLQAQCAELGESVHWRPFMVGGVFNTVNPTVYEQRAKPVPHKLDYARKDMADWARRYGLVINHPSIFPINSVKAMRGCLWLLPQGRMEAFARAVFEAYWRDNRDIRDDAVLADVCRQVGIEDAAFFEGIARKDIADALRANGDELVRRGGFGSPTMFVGGDDMYFGNDRLPLVRDAILARRSPPQLGRRTSNNPPCATL